MEYVLSILTFLVTGTCLFSSRVIPSFSFPGEYINIGKYACYGRLMMLLSPLFVCSGCIKDSCGSGSAGLLEPEGYAEITIDWGMDECPQGARFLFYDESGDLVKEEEGSDGSFRVSLPVGKYRIIVHNSDAEQVGYRGMDKYETAEIFSQSADMSMSYLLQVKDMITGQPYITEPSSVFAAGSCKEFGELDITDGGTLKATVNPVCVTRSMEFHFDVSGVENIASLKGMLSGVAQGVFIASGKHNASSCCSVEFDILAGGIQEGALFVRKLNVFNVLLGDENPAGNILDVALTDNSGVQHTATVDLTETLNNITNDNGGEVPSELPMALTFDFKPVTGLVIKVKPWEPGSDGGSDVEKPVV